MALPNEILCIILTQLGKADLLNCRLLNRAMNLECLKLLKESGTCIILNEGTLESFVQFLQAASQSLMGLQYLPVNLQIEYDQWAWLDPVNLDESWSKRRLASCQAYVDKMAAFERLIDTLNSMLGSNCVRNFSLCYDSPSFIDQFPSLVSFLAKICLGLEVLNLYCCTLCSQTNEFGTQVVRKHGLIFPNLKKFKCMRSSNGGSSTSTTVNKLLLDVSPALDNLVVPSWSLPAQITRFDGLTKLKIFPHEPEEFLQHLTRATSQSSPSLKKLCIWIKTYSELNRATYASILKHFSSSLTSLRLMAPGMISSPEERHSFFPFPYLPNLVKFRLDWNQFRRNKIALDFSQNQFSPVSMPNLRTVEFPADCDFGSEISGENAVVFPAVQNLTLRSNHCSMDTAYRYYSLSRRCSPHHRPRLPGQDVIQNLEKMLEIFPNVARRSVLNYCPYGKPQHVEFLLSECSPWRVKKVVVGTCDPEYLRQLLNELELQCSHTMPPPVPQIILDNSPRNRSVERELRSQIQTFGVESKTAMDMQSLQI